MVAGIRRYKGVRKPLKVSGARAIRINGRFAKEWDDVEPEFRDHLGDVEHRDEKGWGSAGRYVNTTGRNDFVTMKVARDADRVYFYAQTSCPISSWKDPNWMLLFIDADQDAGTGWNGYDYVANLDVKDRDVTSLHSLKGPGWNPKKIGDVQYAVAGPKLELAIPRDAIGMGKGDAVEFDFHWADNIQKRGDIVEFAINGDSAPQRRFNYRYSGK